MNQEGTEQVDSRAFLRRAAALFGAPVPLPQLLERLAALLHEFSGASAVCFDLHDPLDLRREFHFADADETSELVLVIPFGERDAGTIILRQGSPCDQQQSLLLESVAAFLGARAYDEVRGIEQHRLEVLAHTDGLTGLANRRSFDEALVSEWRRCARSHAAISLLLLDIDYFKVFNDTYGHSAGDDCLHRVAQALAACARRPGDLAARYGGEEFAILLPETSAENAFLIAESAAQMIRDLAIPHAGSSLGYVTASLGCAQLIAQPSDDPRELVLRADTQLYRAKEHGRNRAVCEARIGEAPRAQRVFSAKHNIAPPRTSLVGRDETLAALESLTAQSRLVTIAGPGGAGKTRLAKELGLRLSSRHRDGVWFIDATAASGSDALARTIAETLFPQAATGVDTSMLARLLSDKDVLLIVDGSEHALEAVAAMVHALLDAASGLRVLVTSREPLDIEGETVHRLAVLPPADSLRLLRERARDAGFDDAFQPTHDDLMLRISERLDGLPLAIEIAAVRAATVDLHILLEQIESTVAAMQSNRRFVPARHQTLHAVLDWSYNLLTAQEQSVLRRLSVFVGGFTAAAAAACCAAGMPESQVAIVLNELESKSLIVREHDGRLRLFDSTREYASEQMQAANESERTRLEHATYFRAYAQESARQMRESFAALETRNRPEMANFREALRLHFDTLPCEATAEFLWWLRCDLSESSGAFRDVRPLIEQQLQRPEISALARARLLTVLGMFIEKRDPQAALKAAEEAQHLFSQAGDRLGWAHAVLQTQLALDAVCGNAPDDAARYQAAEVARAANDRWLTARLLMTIAKTHAMDGDAHAARSYLDAAESAADAHDLTIRLMIAGNRGLVLMQIKEYDEAARVLRSVAESTAERRPWLGAIAFVNLALAELFCGDLPAVREALTQAVSFARRFPNIYFYAIIFDVFAALAARMHRCEAGAQFAGFAEQCFTKTAARQPDDQHLFDEAVACFRAELTDAFFTELRARGEAMTPEQAVALAATL